MTILFTLALVIAAIIALLFVAALFMRKEYTVRREVIINASVRKVFDYVRNLKNQDNFNKWVMVDPAMKRDFKGKDGTVGFIYGWKGNKRAGEGEQEITAIVEEKSVESEVRFIRPFTGTAYAKMVTESVSGNQTRVIWNNASKMKVPLNLMISKIETMLGKDMDESLNNLKTILEK